MRESFIFIETNANMRFLSFVSIFGLFLLFSACRETTPELPEKYCRWRKIYQRGVSTYYGKQFDYRLTSSGQVFRKEKFTAAHRELPLGTIIRVRNLENLREVVVLVNDRGPVKKTLILDLSKAAAIHLDMVRKGSAKVEIEVLSNAKNPLKKIFETYRNLPYCDTIYRKQ